ncbi:hypothetical protein BDV93DRAFT_523799 [Ceratobasidium sp. AG-I]|nr:hypothetical protein BDV93DRAFT_523799 [Ceratobasidium sp. AG-I]
MLIIPCSPLCSKRTLRSHSLLLYRGDYAKMRSTSAIVATLARHIFISRCVTVAGFALLIYDHALTFHAEVNFVWPAKRSAVKTLFLLNRYMVPVFLALDAAHLTGFAPWLGDKFCQGWILADIIMELLTLFAATFMIGMRVYILWDNRRTIFLLVSVAWVIHVAANIALVIVDMLKNTRTYALEPVFWLCTGSVEDTWAVWIPVMFYHCFIMVLLTIKSLYTPRNLTTRIHDVMIRDGFIYFFVVFLALLFNLLSWALAPPSLAALPRWFVWSICTTATSRLLLSLKGIQTAEDWNKANRIARRDIELVPRNQVKFMFTEHEDDVDGPELSRIYSKGRLKTTTLGRFDD